MKRQHWPSTYQGEEKTIPARSHNASDIVVELRIRTNETQKLFEELIMGHPHFCLEHKTSNQSTPAELIVLEAGYDHYPIVSFIKSIKQQNNPPDIFLLSEFQDMALAAQAKQIGVEDFFPRPLQVEEISEALDRCATRKGRVPKTRRKKLRSVVSFFGARGGIGTTTTAVNFGVSLRKANMTPSVVLLELNPHAGDLALFLNLPMTHTLRELGDKVSQLDEGSLNKFLIKHDSGLHILSAGYTDAQAKPFPTEWIEPIVMLLKTHFDIVLIDCGHTLDKNTTTALGLSSVIFVLSTLTTTLVKRTELILGFLKRSGIPSSKIQWVLNRYTEKENNILGQTEKIFNTKTSWIIPNDFPRASEGMNTGCPVVLASPNSGMSKSFRHMTKSFLKNPDAPDSDSSNTRRWINRIWSTVLK